MVIAYQSGVPAAEVRDMPEIGSADQDTDTAGDPSELQKVRRQLRTLVEARRFGPLTERESRRLGELLADEHRLLGHYDS